MRINGAPYIVDLGGAQAASREVKAEAGRELRAAGNKSRFDKVEISRNSRELERLKQDLAALPEVRLDRVALARQNMQGGAYRVAPEVLAQRMMEAFGA